MKRLLIPSHPRAISAVSSIGPLIPSKTPKKCGRAPLSSAFVGIANHHRVGARQHLQQRHVHHGRIPPPSSNSYSSCIILSKTKSCNSNSIIWSDQISWLGSRLGATSRVRPTATTTISEPSRRFNSSMAAPSQRHHQNDNNNGATSSKELSSEEISGLIKHYGRKHPTSASLETLMKTAKGELLHKHSCRGGVGEDLADNNVSEGQRVNIQVANFLRRELPVRLAHRIQDLSSVPFLSDMESVKAVKEIYIQSLLQISSIPPIHTPQEEEQFATGLEKLYEKHSNVLIQMAKGAYELRKKMRKGEMAVSQGNNHKNNNTTTTTNNNNDDAKIKNPKQQKDVIEFEQMQQCHTFLDRFYMSRIGIRVLAGQYLALRQQILHYSDPNDPNNDYIGIICKSTSPYQAVLQAAEDATWMCQRKYGDAPEVIVSGNLDLTFPYIPTHLHYILLELIKNAMRATMDKHGGEEEAFWSESDEDVPPVHVVIADGKENEDVVIKVSDEGGGIPRSHMKKIWSYLFTTASPSIQERLIAFGTGGDGDHGNNNQMQDHSVHSPLAGLGYGLPISRSYARYFGGDLSIMSMEGYGTDCFLHLRRLGNTREPLPV